jgi:hypothetical protein
MEMSFTFSAARYWLSKLSSSRRADVVIAQNGGVLQANFLFERQQNNPLAP